MINPETHTKTDNNKTKMNQIILKSNLETLEKEKKILKWKISNSVLSELHKHQRPNRE